MGDLPPLSDLVDEPSDLRRLPALLKEEARERREAGEDVRIEDLLAMSRKNDMAYPTDAAIEKAEWFADLYNEEDRPETHPRDFHYTLLGGGHTLRDGETPYENTDKCWRELKEGAFWAQVLGLVDPDRLGDAKNDDPTPTAFSTAELDSPPSAREDSFAIESPGSETLGIQDGVDDAKIKANLSPMEFEADDVESLIKHRVNTLVDYAFRNIRFDAHAEQDYYLELWCEKSGVLDEELADEYGATIREAGGGEFSLEMCRDALRIARERGQHLVVGVVSDLDPKGLDMPRSCGRKLEVLAAMEPGIEVLVHHVGLTKEQAVANDLPASPAKEPRGTGDRNPGALAYNRQKEYFEDYVGDDPVEVNSFRSRAPDAYEQAIRDTLDPYYDHDLAERIDEAVDESRQATREALYREFAEEHEEIAHAADVLADALDDYQDALGNAFETVREEVERLRDFEHELRERKDVPRHRDDLRDALREVDPNDVLDYVSIDTPRPETPGAADDALLDTRRGYDEQLEAYQEFDVRY